MAVYKVLDFSDIVTAVREELGIQSSDTNAINKIKRNINMIYLHEVVPSQRWWWLNGHTEVVHKAYHGEDTATVTPDSATVTLDTAPPSAKGSFAGYYFSVDGFDEVYRISTHTAAGTAITLTSEFQGQQTGSVGYKIWRDTFDLPTDCRETVEVYHDRHQRNMKGIGLQEYRRISSQDGHKTEGLPTHYTTGDFYDPSSGTDELEADRYRRVKIYPSVYNQNVTIHFDYVKEAEALEDDADEPLMPKEDRIVLVYGALSRTWTSIGRNPEEAGKNQALFDRKLAAMAGRVEDSFDHPTIAPKSRYLGLMRASRIRPIHRGGRREGGEGSWSNITYVKDITIDGASLTDDMTVTAGKTIDGRDISADGVTLDSLAGSFANIDTANRVVVTDGTPALEESTVTSTELTFLNNVEEQQSVTLSDNTTNGVAASWDASTYAGVTVHYRLSRTSSNREVGTVHITHDGTNAAIANSYAEVGTMGVSFTVDVSGSTVRLLYTTTSTGNDVDMIYKSHQFTL